MNQGCKQCWIYKNVMVKKTSKKDDIIGGCESYLH